MDLLACNVTGGADTLQRSIFWLDGEECQNPWLLNGISTGKIVAAVVTLDDTLNDGSCRRGDLKPG